MERLARLNMALVQQRNPLPSQTQPSQLMLENDYDHPHREAAHSSDNMEQRLQRLQATIVQQAKEIERLRHQLTSMVPTLPLDGATHASRGLLREDDSSDDQDNQTDEEGSASSDDRARGREKLPLTSLHAQLKARDAEIRRLEQHASQLTHAVDTTRETKRHAVLQYQQITKAQQTQLKKYAASVQFQQRTQRSLEKRVEELNEYVDVLEKKLLLMARSTHRTIL